MIFNLRQNEEFLGPFCFLNYDVKCETKALVFCSPTKGLKHGKSKCRCGNGRELRQATFSSHREQPEVRCFPI